MVKRRKNKRQTEIFERKIYNNPEKFLSSGNTYLNCALSGGIANGAYHMGTMVNIVGDSHTGKSVLALAALASAAINPLFDEFELIYDDVEHARTIDISNMFSPNIEDRLDFSQKSKTIEDFRNHYYDKLTSGKKMVYVLDSFDALSSKAETERIVKEAEGKKADGSYKTEKPLLGSELFRVSTPILEESGSILIIVSQVRQTIGFKAMFQPLSRNGGKGLDFYAHQIFWLSNVGAIKPSESRKDFILGNYVKAKCTKNRVSGKPRTAKFAIYSDYGLDDVESMVEFLKTEKVFIPNTTKYSAKEIKESKFLKTSFDIFGEQVRKENLISYIEENDLEEKVKELVADTWQKIEENISIKRKKRW
jgi:RecA/RadA recombinase